MPYGCGILEAVKQLSPKEIYQRMMEWRNIKKLHEVARERVEYLEQLIKEQKKSITLLQEQNHTQNNLIQTLQLRVEELERMLFGKKRKKKEANDEQNPKTPHEKPPSHRPPASYHRRVPAETEITDTEPHLIDTCSDCGTPLIRKKTIIFYEEDIALPTQEKKLAAVVQHIIEKGFCTRCQKWRTALPPPPAPVVLGKNVKLYICYLSILIRLSYEQIHTLLQTTYMIRVSDGEISNILEQEAIKLRPEYEALAENIRNQQGAHYDETSWQVQKEEQGRFAWVMTGTETNDAVFSCGQSRGKGNAESLKGDSTHIGISDDYGAYRTLFTHHQLCWAHPQRKLRDLATADTLSEETRAHCKDAYQQFAALYQKLRTLLVKLFNEKERKEAHVVFLQKLQTIATPHPLDPKKLRTIKESLQKNKESYLTCLLYENIPPDNNKAERALRHLVLKRKTSFGSRTQRGAETFSILASVLLSLWWRKPVNFFQEYIMLRGE